MALLGFERVDFWAIALRLMVSVFFVAMDGWTNSFLYKAASERASEQALNFLFGFWFSVISDCWYWEIVWALGIYGLGVSDCNTRYNNFMYGWMGKDSVLLGVGR